MFTVYRTVKRGVAENVPDRASVYTGVNRSPIRYTFCDAPFHCPVQCELALELGLLPISDVINVRRISFPSSYIRPFFKEFRVVGQICREGMDEGGILPKARYAMTVGHCLKQQGVWGRCKLPSGSRPEPWWGSQKLQRSCSTQYRKNAPQKLLSWYIFICVLHTN